MKANELRIGNLVYLYDNLEVIIEKISSQGTVALSSTSGSFKCESFPIDTIKPIPLTEEWLVKFGFEKINSTWFDHRNFRINISGDVEWVRNWTHVRVKYVHQIQNLYFALTGEELTMQS